MALAKDYRCKKMNAGPGGWGCPCCNPFNKGPRRMKVLARRYVRHVAKSAIRKVDVE